MVEKIPEFNSGIELESAGGNRGKSEVRVLPGSKSNYRKYEERLLLHEETTEHLKLSIFSFLQDGDVCVTPNFKVEQRAETNFLPGREQIF